VVGPQHRRQCQGGVRDVRPAVYRSHLRLKARDNIPATLKDLFVEMGRVYVPVILANAAAVAQGAANVESEVDGLPWVQEPFPYQAKCVKWIGEEYGKLDAAARQAVSSVIAGTGCERLLPPA
jgi:hypothetical protein